MRSRQFTTERCRARLPVVAVVLAIAVTACSGGGAATVKRRTSTTSAPEVLNERIANGGSDAGTPATRFTLDDGTTVLVPVGAVAPDATVSVKRTTPTGSGQGPMELGTSTYEVTVSKGAIAKPVVLQLPATDATRTGAIAVQYDTASRAWVPTNGDLAAGSLTIYASGAGTFGSMRWSWATAANIGAETVAALVGGVGAADASPSCGDTSSLATRFATRATGNADVLRWCGGTASGNDGLGVSNAGATPLALRTTGLSDASTTRRRSLTDHIVTVARTHWSVPVGEGLNLLAPGDRIQFRLTEGQVARATLVPTAFSQYYVALAGAVAFTAGLYAGAIDVAGALLDREELRTALLTDLDKPGCADTAASTVGEATAGQLAAVMQTLATTCVSRATVTTLVNAAAKQSALRAAFAALTTDLPEADRALVAPALGKVVPGLVPDTAAGEVTATPVDPSAPTTTGVPPTLSVNTVVVVPPSNPAPTVPFIATTTTAVTSPGPTTTPATTVVPTTTTTVGQPVPPTLVSAPLSCSSRNRGTVTLTATGLTPAKSHTFAFTAPNGAISAVTLITPANGVAARVFQCASQRQGVWTVTVTDNGTGLDSAPGAFAVTR